MRISPLAAVTPPLSIVRNVLVVALLISVNALAPCASRADVAAHNTCDGITLELTCPTSGSGVRQTLTTLDPSSRSFLTRGFVQEAWRTSNSLRITVPFATLSQANSHVGSPRLGDVEFEFVRAAESHQHTSRAAGIDVVLPTGAKPFSAGRFSFDPFYSTYTKVRPRMLLLSFAQVDVDSGPHANQQLPLIVQCTLVRLLPHGYYVGTRVSGTSTAHFDAISSAQRFQVGSTSNRGHVALFVDVPLNSKARMQSLMTYGMTYNVVHY